MSAYWIDHGVDFGAAHRRWNDIRRAQAHYEIKPMSKLLKYPRRFYA